MSPTGQNHNMGFGLLPKSLLPASPRAAWLPGKKGKSGSSGCLVEPEHRRQQPVNQQQPGPRETWQTLTPAPWSPSGGAVDPRSDADQ